MVPATAVTRPLDARRARLVTRLELILASEGSEDGRAIALEAPMDEMEFLRDLYRELPDVLADTLDASLPPREDRAGDAPLFPGCSADRLRTSIARACRAAGVPVFSPHDLRHRRISVLHRQGRSWAEIARFVGQRKLSLTADTYTHVLSDGREVAYAALREPAT